MQAQPLSDDFCIFRKRCGLNRSPSLLTSKDMSLIVLLWLSRFASPIEEKVKVISLQQLNTKAIQQDDDTLYVVNFWATWCKPCVAEMPYFEEADKKFASQK